MQGMRHALIIVLATLVAWPLTAQEQGSVSTGLHKPFDEDTLIAAMTDVIGDSSERAV